MLREGEVVICPDCPRKSIASIVASKSWNRQETHDNIAKLCAKMRSYESTLPRCPKYPEEEILDPWLIGDWGCKKRKRKMKMKKQTITKRTMNIMNLLMNIAKRKSQRNT